MSINAALSAIYAEKMITPQMERFLKKAVRSQNLTYAEKQKLRALAHKIQTGEILLLSAQ